MRPILWRQKTGGYALSISTDFLVKTITKRVVNMTLRSLILTLGLLAACVAQAQTATVLRATELRSDKLVSAPVLSSLSAGAPLSVLSVEGGWVEVTQASAQGPVTGWVRANALKLPTDASAVRSQADSTASTLGVRSLPPRINRHALIIGISRYADASTPPLPGALIDRESATQMAAAMQVPPSNITYLHDEQATGNNIRSAIRNLTERVQDGDRVFIHYSGHGTRYKDPVAGGCVEALLAYDGGQSSILTNREMTGLLQSITNKTDKLFVMYDACHSGGLVNIPPALRTRGLANPNDDGVLRPKFAAISDECGRPVNVKTRNLMVEMTNKGALPQDIIHISAARDNEISFDDSLKGGLATQFVRDCMLRDAVDLDKSGAISMDEIRQCAQEKINKRMQNDSNYSAHNVVLSGNTSFVPAWFSQAQIASSPVMQPVTLAVQPPPTVSAAAPTRPAVTVPLAATMSAPTVVALPAKPPAVAPVPPAAPTVVAALPPKPTNPVPPAAPVVLAIPAKPTTPAFSVAAVPAPVAAPVPVVVAVAPPAVVPPLTGEQALRQMFEQRDAKRRVQVSLNKTQLKIGQDTLDFSLQSDRPGYVYVALAGSDNKSLYLLFPNDLDQNNKIEAGQTMQLPRDNWRVKAGGPAGTDNLLVLVTDGPRDLSQLSADKAGPFLASLNDADGRAKLGALMSTSRMVSSQVCRNNATRKNNPLCSDAYGASMVTVEEIR